MLMGFRDLNQGRRRPYTLMWGTSLHLLPLVVQFDAHTHTHTHTRKHTDIQGVRHDSARQEQREIPHPALMSCSRGIRGCVYGMSINPPDGFLSIAIATKRVHSL